MRIKRKELPCPLGKVTVEEFHDGFRLHIALIAERNDATPLADEYAQAYQAAGITIKSEKREIRFSVPDTVVMGLVQTGELGPETDIISALQILARAAWAHKNDPDPIWAYQQYVWAPQSQTTTATPFTTSYGFQFRSGPADGLDF